MPTSLVWLSSSDPAFPPQLAQYLGDKAPARIAAIGYLGILQHKTLALICSVKVPGTSFSKRLISPSSYATQACQSSGAFTHRWSGTVCGFYCAATSQSSFVQLEGFKGMRVPREHYAHLHQGRLLYLSPFSETVHRPTIDIALQRNHSLGAIADRIFVPYASPSSKTLELCSVLISWKKIIYTLANEANFSLLNIGAQPLNAANAIPQLSGR